jgi:O-antigen/teichoic acid export membrane protein
MPVHSERRSQGALTPVLWAGAERWGHQLLSFAVLAVLARLLEPTAFGLVALASLCLSFFTIVINQGIGLAIVRLRHLESKHLTSSFWIAIAIAVVLLAVTIFVAPFASRWVGGPELAPVLQVLALSLPVAALTVIPAAILTRDLRFDALTKRTVIGVIVGGAAGILTASLGWGVWSLVIQQMTMNVIGAVFLWTAVQWRPAPEMSVRHLRDVGGVAAAVVFNGVAWFICERADQAVIGTGIGPHELALYAMAMRLIVLVIDLVCAPIAQVALPMLSQLQDDRPVFEASYVRLTAGSVFLGMPSIVGVALVAPDVVAIVFGDGWQGSAVVIRLLLGYGLIRNLFNLFDPAMLAKGKTVLYMTLLLLSAASTVVASLIGLTWGLEGVAIATTINMLLHGILGLFVLELSLGVRVRVLATSVGPLLLSSACMGLSVLLLRIVVLAGAAPWVSLLGSVAVGVLVYGAAVHFLAPDLRGDVRRIARRLTALGAIGS